MIRYEHRDRATIARSTETTQPSEAPPPAERATAPGERNIAWEERLVSRVDRESRNEHPAAVVWLTGLSGSGKTTIARQVEKRLFDEGHQVTLLDGDNVRHGLNEDLGFSAEDRVENIRRIGRAAQLQFEAGMIVLCSFISPYKADRDLVRALFPADHYLEVYVQASVDECIRRDKKGLYKRALAGEIADFTGISAPYEVPEAPDLTLDTESMDLSHCIEAVVSTLRRQGLLKGDSK